MWSQVFFIYNFGCNLKLNPMLERLHAEILYWKAETDKRKVQLGEYLLDDPCDPDDSLWERLAAREVAEARLRVSNNPAAAMEIIMELVRDKQECLVSGDFDFMRSMQLTLASTDPPAIQGQHHCTSCRSSDCA
jgi:hypothetical protein